VHVELGEDAACNAELPSFVRSFAFPPVKPPVFAEPHQNDGRLTALRGNPKVIDRAPKFLGIGEKRIEDIAPRERFCGSGGSGKDLKK
jgi:hypothetical protein